MGLGSLLAQSCVGACLMLDFTISAQSQHHADLVSRGPADGELSALKQACQQAALVSKFDRPLSERERSYIEAAHHYLEIAMRNDDQRKADVG